MKIPYSIENQTGSDIVLSNYTIVDGETYLIPLSKNFYNANNAGVFNVDFTGITVLDRDSNSISQDDFWLAFSLIQDKSLFNILQEGISSERAIPLEGGIILRLANEDVRDEIINDPEDGDSYFNLRLSCVEIYNGDVGLWLNPHLIVVSNLNDLEEARICYVNSEETVSGVEYPVVDYPTNGNTRGEARGVLIQKNDTTGLASLAVSGQFFVEFGETILINEYVRAKTNGANSDEGYAQGQSGTSNGQVGWAHQNSGATSGKEDFVLVNLTPEWR